VEEMEEKKVKVYTQALKNGAVNTKFTVLKENPNLELAYFQGVIDTCDVVMKAMENPEKIKVKKNNKKGYA